MFKPIPPTYSRHASAALARRGAALERLTTGKRVNRAADDAAGLGVATNLKTEGIGQRMALRNVSTAQSMISTAESGLEEIVHNLQRMRELAMASASETLDDDERAFLASEFSARIDEIDDIAARTQFDDTDLLAGAGIDVAFLINTSLSMSLEISALVSAVSAFESNFAAAGLDVSMSLSEINAGRDSLDGSVRRSSMGDGTFQTQLAGITTTFGLQDPYAAVLEATGLVDIVGDIDPDDVQFRIGAKERHIIFLGDDPRELDLVPGTETPASVGTALADAGFIVHAVIDPAVTSTYSPLVSATGGTTHNAGSVGQFISTALDSIATIITDRVGSSDPISVQAGTGSNTTDRIELGLPINATASGLGLTTQTIASTTDSWTALDAIDSALDIVNEARATLGAKSSRLDSTANRLVADAIPLASAESRIRDIDMAEAVSEQTMAQIAAEASVAALSQARGLAASSVTALLS